MFSGEFDAGVLAVLVRSNQGSPLHTRLEAGLRQLIRSGQFPPGTELPGELDLAASLRLSRHTVRHALATLAVEGLIRRQRGRGTHVVNPIPKVSERSLNRFYAFAWELKARGLEPRSPLLECATLEASDELASRLDLGEERMVQKIVRIRTAGAEPLIIETAYIPRVLAEGLDTSLLERASIYDDIERRHGLRVTRAHETIRPTVLTRAAARLMHVRAGSAAFHIERTTWAGNQPVEWQESIVRGDRFLYSIELDRPEPESV